MSRFENQDISAYVADRDLHAIKRIWREVGWTSDSDPDQKALAELLESTNVEVALLDGEAECSVIWTPGLIRYQATELPLCVVAGVTTSHIARRFGFATSMTARAIRQGAESGAAVAALGMFDQGFYDRLGFGSNGYHNTVSFDPGMLDLDVAYRTPIRLGVDDHLEIHQMLKYRERGHGAVLVEPPMMLSAELRWLENRFGFGYRGDDGKLTAIMFGEIDGEFGPYRIRMISYREPHHVLDLLRLLQEMSDQVTSVTMPEPAELQLQDLIRKPIAQNRRTKGSDHASGISTAAFMQFRILDLATCVAARRWRGPELRCNLTLTDPAAELLAAISEPDHEGWSGIAGEYQLRIGAPSSLLAGHDPSLPTLTAAVGPFSRCWFGARPATGLALTEDFDGPPDLLTDLDEALALPAPKPAWDF